MKRVLVLGGGVGGTLVANLVSRKLKKQIAAGDVSVTVVDESGTHTYQPGFMYIAMGGERQARGRRRRPAAAPGAGRSAPDRWPGR